MNAAASFSELSLAPSRNSHLSIEDKELSLHETACSDKFNCRVVKVLNENRIKCHIKDGLVHVGISENERRHFAVGYRILNDESACKEIPRHCALHIKEPGNDEVIPVWLESYRINECVVENVIHSKLPVARLSLPVDEQSHTYQCTHVECGQCAMSSISEPRFSRFLITTDVLDNYAIVFSSQENNIAIMAHISQSFMCDEVLDLIVSKISKYAPVEKLKASIIGGYVNGVNERGGFFHCIEPYLKGKKISIHQTFIGEDFRPQDLLFDCSTGAFYELNFPGIEGIGFPDYDHESDECWVYSHPEIDSEVKCYFSPKSNPHSQRVNATLS